LLLLLAVSPRRRLRRPVFSPRRGDDDGQPGARAAVAGGVGRQRPGAASVPPQ
jgi:hypothetical protein